MEADEKATTYLAWAGEPARSLVWDAAVRICIKRGGKVVTIDDISSARRKIGDLGGLR